MEWVEGEPLWLVCPGFADEFVWCEAFEGLEAFGEVVGLDEVSEVVAELFVGVVVEPPDGSVLDGAVHAFDLAMGPRMLWLGQPVIDVGEGTGVFESSPPSSHPRAAWVRSPGHAAARPPASPSAMARTVPCISAVRHVANDRPVASYRWKPPSHR